MNLVMPVLVLFYQSHGMSMQDVFTLQAVYSFTLMFLEIPTGFFADKYGRRNSMILGSFFGVAGYLIYTSLSGFWMFVLAEMALGIGQSLISGADSAMLYDSLKVENKAGKYVLWEGRVTSLGNFAEAIAGFIGGFLAITSLYTPFYFQVTIAFLAIPAAFLLTEPPVRTTKLKPDLLSIPAIIKETIISNPHLRWNTLFSAIVGVSTLSMAWFAQPYLISKLHSTDKIGIAWAVLNAIVGFGALYAWKIEKKAGIRTTAILFTLTILAGYFVVSMNLAIPGLMFLALFYFARGVATPLLRSYINKITGSETRATVLSIRNFIIRGLFVILGPLFGYLIDSFGLSKALFSAAVFFSVTILFTMSRFLKYNIEILRKD